MAMTATADHARADPHHIGVVIEHPGPAPKRIVTAYGFWIFLLSDIVMFSCFFAAYAVLSGQTAGGPKGSEILSRRPSRSRRSACCCRASPAAWPASLPMCATGSGSISP